MTQTLDQSTPATPVETDLVAAVHAVLQGSPEPMTLSKIRAKLPTQMRQIGLEELAEALRRQVAANVLYQYPKYRSQQDRFWDRPMPVHVAYLLRVTLAEEPLNAVRPAKLLLAGPLLTGAAGVNATLRVILPETPL